MLASWKEEVEEIIFPGKISVPYFWTVGSTLSKWYALIRDECEIWANRCPECEMVFVPPKIKCINCYKDLNEWIKLPGTGTIETFTVVTERFYDPKLHPRKAPFVYAVIKMDGADTGLVHFVGGVSPEKVKVGMRVEPVFEKERNGNILDIKHFRPVS